MVLEWNLLNMTVQQWRNKHRRCAWCSHCEKRTYTEIVGCGLDYRVPRHYCTAKLKTVDHMIPRLFCRVFEQRKDD